MKLTRSPREKESAERPRDCVVAYVRAFGFMLVSYDARGVARERREVHSVSPVVVRRMLSRVA